MVRGSNPGGAEIFRTRPYGSHSLLSNRNWLNSPEVKPLGHGDDYPHPPSAEVEDRIQLYLYCSYNINRHKHTFL